MLIINAWSYWLILIINLLWAGGGGELRKYLEKIAAVENIPEFVKENPFGQSAITLDEHPHWSYYYGILEALKRLAPAF